jgi:hypothetical protein
MTLPFVDVVGFWIGIFLTFCILSYLYKDNPFYKLAEHIFVGVSIGYVITQQYYNVIRPNLLDHLAPEGARWYEIFIPSVYWIPLILVAFLFVRSASRRLAWLGRYPIAFVVALYAGIQINAVAESDLAQQIAISTRSVVVPKKDLNDPRTTVEDMATLPGFSPPVALKVEEAREAGMRFTSLDDLARVPGLTDPQREDLAAGRGVIAGLDAQAAVGPGEQFWFGILSRILLLVGLLASLIYFYFSIEQKGAVRTIARFGVYVLMLGFGASFGYTVQGRLALAVGRAMDVLDIDKAPATAAQINGPIVCVVVIVLIIVGLVAWERWWLPRQARRAAISEPPPDEDLPAY